MMLQTLHQTSVVSPNHQVTVTLPGQIPAGEVELVIVIQSKPAIPQTSSKEETRLKLMTLINQSQRLQSTREMECPPLTRSLLGLLTGTPLDTKDYQLHLEDKYL